MRAGTRRLCVTISPINGVCFPFVTRAGGGATEKPDVLPAIIPRTWYLVPGTIIMLSYHRPAYC